MIMRQLTALASGVIFGVVVQECLWGGLDAVLPWTPLNRLLEAGPRATGWLAPLVGTWIAGGASGALMATLIGRGRFAGYATGLLLSVSALLLTGLLWLEAGWFRIIAAAPALGAAPGTWVGLALLAAERQPDTFREPEEEQA